MTPSRLIVRCSSLDRVIDCAGSLAETDAPYSPRNPEAREGSSCHEALRDLARGNIPEVDAIGTKWDVEPDVISKVVARGQEAWRDIEQWFAGERHADDLLMAAALNDNVELRGTPDLLAVDVVAGVLQHLSVLDWKTGWAPSDHPHQLRGYAYLARAKYGMPASGYILGIEVWVRVGVIRVHRFTAEDLDALAAEVVDQTRRIAKQFGPSADACKYCPLQTSCQARAEWLRSGVTALVPVAANQPVTRELVGSLYDRYRELTRALETYRDVLDGMLEEGPVPIPGGAIKLAITVERQEQDSLVPSKAMQVLREDLRLAPDEADRVLSVRKGALEKVVKARAGNGQGAAAWRATMKRLTELGAVEKTSKRQLKVAPQEEEKAS